MVIFICVIPPQRLSLVLVRSEEGSFSRFGMADLNSSLTAMDWLPQLGVGGPITDDSLKPRFALRQVPGSTLDTTATLDEQQARLHQGKTKPPYSYANLITFAINSNAKKKMTLNEIYTWICDNFPYYHNAGNGWKVWDKAIIGKMQRFAHSVA